MRNYEAFPQIGLFENKAFIIGIKLRLMGSKIIGSVLT